MKKILLMMSLLLTISMFCACSNSDEDSYLSNSNLENEVDSVQNKIKVSFSLLNDKGKPDSLFREGKDICFELMITNSSDKKLFFFDDIFLGNELFSVYREDGTYVGTPWTSIGTNYCGGVIIGPKSSARRRCKWIGMVADSPIEKKHELDPLPKGNYYTKFSIKYRDLDNVIQDMFIEKEFYVRFIIQ